jgi:hypothetical protein
MKDQLGWGKLILSRLRSDSARLILRLNKYDEDYGAKHSRDRIDRV